MSSQIMKRIGVRFIVLANGGNPDTSNKMALTKTRVCFNIKKRLKRRGISDHRFL